MVLYLVSYVYIVISFFATNILFFYQTTLICTNLYEQTHQNDKVRFPQGRYLFCIYSAAKVRRKILPLTDSYRILPHLTAFYRILPHSTETYRILPIGGSFAVPWTANDRITNGKRTDKCKTHFLPENFCLLWRKNQKKMRTFAIAITKVSFS